MGRQYYFGQVEFPMSTSAAAAMCYRDPNPDQLRLFENVNGFGDRNGILYPGHMLVVPGLGGGGDDSAAFASAVGTQVNHTTANARKKPEPSLFNQHFGTYLYSQMKSDTGRTGFALDVVNAFQNKSAEFIDGAMSSITDDLIRLNDSYRSTTSSLRGIDFAQNAKRMDFGATGRAEIYTNIQNKLRQLPERFRMANPTVGAPEDLLGISNSMVKRHFRGGTNPNQLKVIRQAISKSASLSSELGSNKKVMLIPFMKNSPEVALAPKSFLKGLGPTLQAAGGVLTVYDYYDRVEKAKKVIPGSADIYAVREGGKAAGGVLGGFAGGELGAAGAAALVLALGTPVGWGAVAVFGLATIGGAAFGGWLGSEAGGRVADHALMRTDPSRANEIRMLMEGPDPLEGK